MKGGAYQIPNVVNQYFNELLTALRAVEIEQKERYDSAIDIEDMAEATAVTMDARTKIQQLRKWIEDLQRINLEFGTAFPVIPAATQESGGMIVDIIPQPTGMVERDNDDDSSTKSIALKGFVLFGKPYNTSSWQTLLTMLCEIMVLKKPYRFVRLGVNARVEQYSQPILTLDEQQIQSGQKLSNGFYVDTGGTENEIKIRCEHILSACGYSSDVLKIL